MMDDKKDNPEIYSLRDPSTLTEKVIIPSGNADIFAIKSPDPSKLGSVIGITLGNGVFLCDAYRLDKQLSRDEMGERWQASDLQASRNVVVYLPPLEKRTDASAMEPVRQAARHVEALVHPRIVPFLDSLTDPEHGFFSVRKFVNGQTLDVYRKEYVKRHKKFALVKAIKMLSDIAHALDYAHSAGVVHGNLCPANILVGLDDEVYVANFALFPLHTIKAVDKQSYFAPEITESALSDVYALAVVTYELLAGRLPFSPETDVPPPIPGVPSTIDAVLRKALARDPEDRYGSCGAFVKALEISFQESMKIKSVAALPSPQRKNIASRPLFWGTLLVLLFVGAAGIVWRQQLFLTPLALEQVAVQQPLVEVPTPAPQQHREPPSNPASEAADGGQQTVAENVGSHPAVDEHTMEITLSSESLTEAVPEEKVETISEIVLTDTMISPPAEQAVPPTEHLPPPPSPDPEDDKPTETSEPAKETGEPTEETGEPAEETEPEQDTPSEIPVVLPPPVLPAENVEGEAPPQDDPPQQDESVSLNVPAPSTSSDDLLREEGELATVTIEEVEYHFRWCKGKPFVRGTDGFWIQETPVTQELWKDVMGVENLQNKRFGNRLPVVQVSWRECEQFLEKLNASEVLGGGELRDCHFSLPTESQWEHASGINEKVEEWCQDWQDDAKNYRIVRGSGGLRVGRDPSRGYENVGFRLVIVRGK